METQIRISRLNSELHGTQIALIGIGNTIFTRRTKVKEWPGRALCSCGALLEVYQLWDAVVTKAAA